MQWVCFGMKCVMYVTFDRWLCVVYMQIRNVNKPHCFNHKATINANKTSFMTCNNSGLYSKNSFGCEPQKYNRDWNYIKENCKRCIILGLNSNDIYLNGIVSGLQYNNWLRIQQSVYQIICVVTKENLQQMRIIVLNILEEFGNLYDEHTFSFELKARFVTFRMTPVEVKKSWYSSGNRTKHRSHGQFW